MKSRPPWSQRAESRWKLLSCVSISPLGLCPRGKDEVTLKRHKPIYVCMGRHHYMWPAPPHWERRCALETMEETFFSIRNTGQHELSTQSVLWAICPSCVSPRHWGGVYWWHCISFHIHNSSQIRSAPVLLNSMSPDWQTIYFMQKNQEHGWRDHTFWVCHLLQRKFF